MTTQVVLVLDTRYTKVDGTAPVIIRIIHHRASSQIKTGIYVTEKDWDAQLRKIKPSYKGTESVMRLNNQLQKKKAEVLDAITKLDEQKRLDALSVVELKNLIDTKSNQVSFTKYAERVIADETNMGKIGNARSYQCAVNVLTTFAKGKDIAFHELTYSFIKKFESYHLAKGTSHNGLATYLKKIRAIYNKAIKDGIVEKSSYPFESYSIKTTKTRKRAIGMDAIKRIIDLSLDADHTFYHSRNYFLLSFYMRGMSFADMAHLKVENIIDGRVFYQRQKTDKPYNIKITPEIQALLTIYTADKASEEYIFPIIKSSDPQKQYQDVVSSRTVFNLHLNGIAKLCDIQEHLTSYVSRHSFATRAKNLGVPIATISDMLGHDNIKTTEVYLDSLPSDIMDEAHERIIR
jgi:site-specific recombinase XerD